MRNTMRTLVRKLFRLPSKGIEIDYTSSSSIRSGFYKAGYRSFDPPILKSFEAEVKELAKNREKTLFRNGTSDHTSIILSEMLKNGQDTFLIYDRDLSGDLLLRNGDATLFDDFKKFLEDGKREIQIIIDSDATINETVLDKLKSLPRGSKLKMFQLNSTSVEKNNELADSPYFAVSDNRAFRVENKSDVEGREALCSFNDEEMSKDLSELFSTLKSSSKELELI